MLVCDWIVIWMLFGENCVVGIIYLRWYCICILYGIIISCKSMI